MIVHSNREIVEELKAIRTEYGMTQKQIAKKAGVTQQTISAIENGSFDPSFKLILKLTKILGLTLSIRQI